MILRSTRQRIGNFFFQVCLAGRLLGVFQFGLTRNEGLALECLVGLSRKNHFDLIFLRNSLMLIKHLTFCPLK